MTRGITKDPAHDILFLHRTCADEAAGPEGGAAIIGRWGVATVTVVWVVVWLVGAMVWLVGVMSGESAEGGGRGECGEEGVRVSVESIST